MGILDKVKKMFATGGLDVELTVPDTFRWSDDSLPVTVQITGDDEAERVVTSVEFTLVEDLRFERDESESPTEHARRERRADERAFRLTREEQFTVPAGEVVTFHVDLPISSGRMEITSEDDAEAPAWLSAASDMVNLVTDSAKEADWFRLEVTPLVEGFSARNVASERIRNLGRGEFGGKGWSVDIN